MPRKAHFVFVIHLGKPYFRQDVIMKIYERWLLLILTFWCLIRTLPFADSVNWSRFVGKRCGSTATHARGNIVPKSEQLRRGKRPMIELKTEIGTSGPLRRGLRFGGSSSEFRERKVMMKVKCEVLDENVLTTDSSAAALGLDELSLLARVQTGEVKVARARSGEMVIPESELERIAGGPVNAQSVENGAILPDESLGIERRYGGLRRDGKTVWPYKVGECRFSEDEINSYRAASIAIATQLRHAEDLNRQLGADGQPPESCDLEVRMSEGETWQVRCALLNLNHSEILLCQRGNEFAVIERFHEGSPYAQANGNAQMLWKGNDAQAVAEAFKDDARLTLKFMVSNLTAKAQKIVWEQFPDRRPGHVVAAISERCHQAIANTETVSQEQKATQSISHGVRI
jgi:hypothetical protein